MLNIELGLGLLSIGRTWGVRNVRPPRAQEAVRLLSKAVAQGIRLFDTAPAYASSERVLGLFLASLPDLRDQLTIATKMGEFWDESSTGTRVSHFYDDLAASIESSLTLLGSVDVLQVHKANAANVLSSEVMRAIDFAESCGIKEFGASVGDIETARLVCASNRYHYIQFPYNSENTTLQPIFEMAQQHGVKILVNRPLAMGGVVADENKALSIKNAYSFVIKEDFDGWILTGTSSTRHLAENVSAFRAACI